MKRTINNQKNALELLKIFFNKYPNYPQDAKNYVKANFLEMIFEYTKTDVVNQIYAELEMLIDYENWYLGFCNMIGEKYGWGINILEIGSGFFPIFSKYIDLKQQSLGKGTIHAYDPNLVTENLGNIVLHKKNFTEDISLDYFDLVVGIMPCDATELIIKKAILSKKQFFVALCGCDHAEKKSTIPYGSSIEDDDWKSYIVDLARSQEKDGFEIKIEKAKEFYYAHYIISSKKINI